MLMNNIFTIDVEEWFHAPQLEPYLEGRRWKDLEARLVPNVHRLLEIMADHRTQATFFILGWVGERYPKLVREIAASGHEIASHGYRHKLVTELTPSTFREYVKRSKFLLEDLTGRSVLGYRAACFSVVKSTLWALDVIKETGFLYDSSMFPIHHDLYGIPDYPRFPYVHDNGLIEIPPSTLSFLGYNIPIAGGGYFRFFPYTLTKIAVKMLNKSGQPAVFYLHPWELDPDTPRTGQADWRTRFRRNINLKKTASRLKKLLSDFSFVPINDYIQHVNLEGLKIKPESEPHRKVQDH